MTKLRLMFLSIICISLLFTGCEKDQQFEQEIDEVTPPTSSVQRSCKSSEYLARQMADPRRKAMLDQINSEYSNYMSTHKATDAAVYTIPVVVHVVYQNGTENISDAQVLSQIDVLNQDFRRLNTDADNTWSQAADIEIEFCLASTDPNGNSTSGITRTQTSVNKFNDNDNVKKTSAGGKSPWDASKYLNVWVCELDDFLGYAQFPGGPAATDGVVCDYRYFGTNGTAQAPFNLGRTGTHEVGHYLNLFHIWGDGPCGTDDEVNDTPASDDANYGCTPSHTSCGNKDMVQNYMDYSDDGCMNLFTQGQKDRMRALLSPGGSRASLLNSPGCNGGGGSNPTCSDGIQNGNETGVDCGGSCTPCDNSTDSDAGISYIVAPRGSLTSPNATPIVRVRNFGTDILSSATITYGIQGQSSQTYQWTGSIAAGKSKKVNLPAMTLPTGTHTFEAKTSLPNGGADANAQNDRKTASFTLNTGNVDHELTIRVKPDIYGSEVTWELLDEDYNVIAEGGPYVDNNTNIKTRKVTVAEGCYTFAIYDDWGDGICCDYGNGFYEVLNSAGQEIVGADGQYGYWEEQDFCLGPNFNGENTGATAKRTTTVEAAVRAKVKQGK